jgi:GntP family gluconate:H+ symporter
MLSVLLLLLSVAFIIFSTTYWKLHPFLALLIAAFLFGVCSGMPAVEVIQTINSGFGDTIGKIGLLIIFGIIIGIFLERSGGALKLAEGVIKVTGSKRVHLSVGLIGYIVSIPVFADSAFLILSSLNKALTRKAKLSLAGTVAALALGLTASHTMVPPTPGPIAAAGILGADLGLVFVIGSVTSLFALGCCVMYSKWTGRNVFIDPNDQTEAAPEQVKESPTSFKAILPLAVPILLIVLRSIAQYPTLPFGEGVFVDAILLLGDPVSALFTGAVLALMLPKKLKKIMLSPTGWIGEALRDAAIIILITGAGGALGAVLKHSDIGTAVSSIAEGTSLGILIPFLMASGIKTAQGSSTVAIITTASIIAPLLPVMGLDEPFSKAAVVIAIGAGSAVVSHVNDSLFWVVTQLSGFSVNEGYRIHTLGTGVLGISAMIFLCLISFIF